MYRTRAAAEPDPEASSSELLRLDVSGRRGIDGPAGADGATGACGGGDGTDGSPAGAARPGEPAGAIRVTLTPGEGTEVHVSGEVASRGDRRPVDAIIDLARPGDLVLLARGGGGGHGGRGGDGGSGATGRAGQDATRSSRGTDGGPGGDGGDGGSGTSGAPGGAGGAIELLVDEDHTHLVLVATAAIGGGAGGAPGENGRGGAGGAGGEGGSSCSWTETEEWTDSQGRTQTRTRHRSSSGGSRGRSGSSGSPGRAVLVGGANGRQGSFAIVVCDRMGGVRRYPRRFDPVLVHLAHAPDDTDGIYEPGESVTVSGVVVQNVGGMPTPARHPTVIGLAKTSWLLPTPGDRLLLDRALDVDARVTLPGTLRFTIASYVPHAAGEPLASEDTIRLGALLPAANRAFAEFEAVRDDALVHIPIRFPVQIGAPRGLPALAPGEATRLAFTLTNVSTRAMGRGTERARRVACRLRFERSELDDAHAWAFDAEGRRVSLDRGLLVELERLEPGATAEVAITLAMAPDAPPYRAARVVASLELGRPSAPDVLGPVQLREHEVRVASRFAAAPDADALLVVGARTTRAALDGWTAACRELGLTPATWDVSLEGHLDLEADLPGGSLMSRFGGGPVIVLDGAVPAPGGATTRPGQLLSRAQAHALHAAGGRLVLVGGDNDPRAWLLRDAQATATSAAGEGTVGRGGDAGDGSPDAVAGDALALDVGARSVERAPTTLRFWGGTPQPEALEEVARDAAEAFARRAPARHRALFAWSFTERVVAETLWIRRFSLGALRALRLPDRGRGRFVHAAAGDVELIDPAWIAARAPAIVAASLSPAAKARRLLALGASDEAGASSLAAAVVDDLAVEVAAEIAAAVLRGGSVEDDELPVLGAVAAASAADAPIDPESAGGAALARLAGHARALGKGHVRLWEWLPPFLWLARRPGLRRLLRRHVATSLDGAFGREGSAREAAERAADEAQRTIEELHRAEKRDALFREGLGRFAVLHALARHEALGLRADESTMPAGVLTMTVDALAELGRADARSASERDATRRALEEAREALLVPGGAASLDARARAGRGAAAAEGDVAQLVRDGVIAG